MRHSFFSYQMNPISSFAAFSMALLSALNTNSFADYPAYSQPSGYVVADNTNPYAGESNASNSPVSSSSGAVDSEPYSGSDEYSSPELVDPAFESPRPTVVRPALQTATQPAAGSAYQMSPYAPIRRPVTGQTPTGQAPVRQGVVGQPLPMGSSPAVSATGTGGQKPRAVVATIGGKNQNRPAATSAQTTPYNPQYTNPQYNQPYNTQSSSPQNGPQDGSQNGLRTSGMAATEPVKEKSMSEKIGSLFGFGSDKQEAAAAQNDAGARNVPPEQANANDQRKKEDELYTDKSGWWKLKPRSVDGPRQPKDGAIVAESMPVPPAAPTLPGSANQKLAQQPNDSPARVQNQTYDNPYGNVANASSAPAAGNGGNPYAAMENANQNVGSAPNGQAPDYQNTNEQARKQTAGNLVANSPADGGNPYAGMTASGNRIATTSTGNPYAGLETNMRPTFSADMGNSFAGETVRAATYAQANGASIGASNGGTIPAPAGMIPPGTNSGDPGSVSGTAFVTGLGPAQEAAPGAAVANNSSALSASAASPSLPSMPPLPEMPPLPSPVSETATASAVSQPVVPPSASPQTVETLTLPGLPPLPEAVGTAPAGSLPNVAAGQPPVPSVPELPSLPGLPEMPTGVASSETLPPNPAAPATASTNQFIASSASGLDEQSLAQTKDSSRLYSPDASASGLTVPAETSGSANDPNWRSQMSASEVPGMNKTYVPVESAKVWAKVGNEVILESDIRLEVNRRKVMVYKNCKESGQKEPSEKDMEQACKAWERQILQEFIQNKIVFADAVLNIPMENLEMVRGSCYKAFKEHQIPILLKVYEVSSQWELERKLEAEGSSLEREKEMYYERAMAGQWLNMQLEEDKDVSYDSIMKYYQENSELFEIKSRARWEELVVRKSKFGSRNQAYNAIAEMGMDVVNGKTFAEVAKTKSQGFSASDGGVRDWITPGSLKSKPLEDAIFSQKVGQMSPQIIEDDSSFYIIRVLERQDEGKVSFEQAQVEIRERLEAIEKENEKDKAYEKMSQNVKVWSVFEGEVKRQAARIQSSLL